VDIIKLLLEIGISINLVSSDGNTPLHLSAACGNLEATKAFVEGGALLNINNKHGNTPLMLASRKRKSEIVRYLTEFGADINVQQRHFLSICCSLLWCGFKQVASR
jgi:ankyrin repeat protein